NAGVIFVPLQGFNERVAQDLSGNRILGELNAKLAQIQEAMLFVVPPPPVRGIGTAGGFSMRPQDRRGRGTDVLARAAFERMGAAAQESGVRNVYTPFQANTPQLFIDVDRVKAEILDVPVANIFEALEVYLGSAYVNDFNLLGRTYQVTAQADAPYRVSREDI